MCIGRAFVAGISEKGNPMTRNDTASLTVVGRLAIGDFVWDECYGEAKVTEIPSAKNGNLIVIETFKGSKPGRVWNDIRPSDAARYNKKKEEYDAQLKREQIEKLAAYDDDALFAEIIRRKLTVEKKPEVK